MKPKGACASKQSLRERTLLSPMLSGQLSGLFKVLSNDTRLRILHELIRREEAGVTELGAALGMSPQAVSNQLVRLNDWRILSSRREGNNVFYRIINPCVPELLDRALCFTESDQGCP
ncbi:MAG: helix-turn-helix transcriptional regulator [Candidatus Eremiobacteraeota bacterium]|jgi:DNA-binding transcriptional ArsR family regulator|nr:helix-turn-helix transcriptional regulator [Candidatus Eremiobacteraeota bacterium]